MEENTFQFFFTDKIFFIKTETVYFIEYQHKRMVTLKKNHIFNEKIPINHLPVSKKFLPLHPQSRNKHRFEKAKCRNATKDGPFVYRLGRKIFILERGVRFPHGLQVKRIKN